MTLSKASFLLRSISMLLIFINPLAIAAKNLKNESSIVVSNVNEHGPMDCKGSTGKKAKLSEIGLSAENLKNGITCVAADFDGNGYIDFLLTGSISPGEKYPAKFLAVLYNKNTIVKQHIFSSSGIRVPSVYRARRFPSARGHPRSKTDGILSSNKTYNNYFLYNPKTKKFKLYTSRKDDPNRYYDPFDEADELEGFSDFRAKLIKAVKNKNAKVILSILDPNVVSSGIGYNGVEQFKRSWRLEAPSSPLWEELATILKMGGCVGKDKKSYYAPSIACLKRAGEFDKDDWSKSAIIAGSNVRAREKPAIKSEMLTTTWNRTGIYLNYNFVKVPDKDPSNDYDKNSPYRWLKVKFVNKKGEGWVAKRFVRFLTDYRAEFVKKNGQWKLSVFVKDVAPKLDNAIRKQLQLAKGTALPKYTFTAHNLDGDKELEVIVLYNDAKYCDTDGCTMQIYKQVKAGQYKFISETTKVNRPVRAIHPSYEGKRPLINGWLSLVVNPVDKGAVELKFDGKQYPATTLKQPKYKYVGATYKLIDIQSPVNDAIRARANIYGDDTTSIYKHALVDLNGDSIKDIIVLHADRYSCGSGGCWMEIYKGLKSGKFKYVNGTTLAEVPVKVLDEKRNGWKTLVVYMRKVGEKTLTFNGRRYQHMNKGNTATAVQNKRAKLLID